MIWIYFGFLLHLFIITFKFCNGIFNGWYAEPGEYPFVVCFVRIPTNTPLCVGMIVTTEKILTTAHCLNKDITNSKVIAGVLDITDNTSDQFQESKVSKTQIHPKYKIRVNKMTLYNIGVGILERPFTFTETVKPLVIASSDDHKMQELYRRFSCSKDNCVSFGWGTTEYDLTTPSTPKAKNFSMKLKVAGIMPEEYEECTKLAHLDSLDEGKFVGIVCAYPSVSKSTPCDGDGGAGLVCGDRKHVYGLLTESSYCGKGERITYLLISQYIKEFGVDQNADAAIGKVHVGNHLLLIGLYSCIFSWYFYQPYP